MKFYFNANNSTQTKALKECGIKNILISYKYMKNQIKDVARDFDSVILIAGNIKNVDEYHDFVKSNTYNFDMAVQYDVPMDMYKTIKYYEKAHNSYTNVAPVLTSNYLNHIGQLKLEHGQYVCLGKMAGKIEEEEQIKKLPSIYKLHGLAKGRLIRNKMLHSVDSSAWLSGVRGRKTEVFDSTPLTFGDKGKTDLGLVNRAIERYRHNFDRCGISTKNPQDWEYNDLLKVTLALYYIPMFYRLSYDKKNLF